MRRARWVRWQISLKPQTDPESVDGTSAIASSSYPMQEKSSVPFCYCSPRLLRSLADPSSLVFVCSISAITIAIRFDTILPGCSPWLVSGVI